MIYGNDDIIVFFALYTNDKSYYELIWWVSSNNVVKCSHGDYKAEVLMEFGNLYVDGSFAPFIQWHELCMTGIGRHRLTIYGSQNQPEGSHDTHKWWTSLGQKVQVAANQCHLSNLPKNKSQTKWSFCWPWLNLTDFFCYFVMQSQYQNHAIFLACLSSGVYLCHLTKSEQAKQGCKSQSTFKVKTSKT